MVDWTAAMQQTYEYYVVDPVTWRDTKQLTTVRSCTITRDSDTATLGSATFDITETLDECYVRVYLVTNQNGIKERHALGTFLVQTPASSFNGKTTTVTVDAYTPLMELKEKPPAIGYYISSDENIMETAYQLARENVRAPVVSTNCDAKLYNNFVSELEDNWLAFLTDLIRNAKYNFALDEMGRILFSPEQDTASLQPVWTFNDNNSSILHPEFSMDRDLYGIPNVVEVVFSTGGGYLYGRAVNDDENSPISTVNRGREIVERVTNPSLNCDNPTQAQVDEYAEAYLRELSTLEHVISYTHGYCPVRLGDCVRVNYSRAKVSNVKAKVISQTIKCVPGCPVTEKAVYTAKLWG